MKLSSILNSNFIRDIMDVLREKTGIVSDGPGVYLMKDRQDRIIYVGKARNLKKRLSSYFRNPDQLDSKTRVLVRKIMDFETIVTVSEADALMLESNLIKIHRPRYNVILKDDKRYPCLRLDLSVTLPKIEVVRSMGSDGAMYFGPFTSPGALRRTLKLLNRRFRLRKCRDHVFRNRSRPCLHHQIGACFGPCCLEVDPEIYGSVVRDVILFLRGKTPELIRKIRSEMTEAAARQDFEAAAELRDRMFALEKVLEKQITVSGDGKDRDVFALIRSDTSGIVTLLSVRSGALVGSRHFHFSETPASDGEILESFMGQYYAKGHFIPPEILVPVALDAVEALEIRVRELTGAAVQILRPLRGEKVRLIQMALQNAQDEMTQQTDSEAAEAARMAALQAQLKLFRLPRRIECFDNSNLAGTAPVSAMVVFENGKPLKSAWRKYKIRTVSEADDYAYMTEVLTRRYGKGTASEPLPDLLMVDGGRGQIGVAMAVLAELGIDGTFDVIGIAKKDEKAGETEDKIYKPNRSNPVPLKRDLRLFLEQIRDEVHRFVITFHRKTRGKETLVSAMDRIPGVGPARKKALLNHFGSFRKIRAATPDELEAVPGISRKLAETICESLRG